MLLRLFKIQNGKSIFEISKRKDFSQDFFELWFFFTVQFMQHKTMFYGIFHLHYTFVSTLGLMWQRGHGWGNHPCKSAGQWLAHFLCYLNSFHTHWHPKKTRNEIFGLRQEREVAMQALHWWCDQWWALLCQGFWISLSHNQFQCQVLFSWASAAGRLTFRENQQNPSETKHTSVVQIVPKKPLLRMRLRNCSTEHMAL